MTPPASASLMQLLNQQIREKDLVTSTRAKLRRQAFERDYVASLVAQTFIAHERQPFEDLLRNVWLLDRAVDSHIVVSLLYDRFVGRMIVIDKHNVHISTLPPGEMAKLSFYDVPATGPSTMTALYALSVAKAPMAHEDLLQVVYDETRDDIATRYGIWELLRSGEMVAQDYTYTLGVPDG